MILARKTGWDEHYIRWELPMHRGNAYLHALMRMEKVSTQPAGKVDLTQVTEDEI